MMVLSASSPWQFMVEICKKELQNAISAIPQDFYTATLADIVLRKDVTMDLFDDFVPADKVGVKLIRLSANFDTILFPVLRRHAGIYYYYYIFL